MALVVISPNRCVLDCPVHSFDLPVRPGVIWLCESVINIVLGAGQNEPMATEPCVFSNQPPNLRGSPVIALRISEVGAVVGEHRMDLVRNRIDQTTEKVTGIPSGDPLVQFGKSELACAIHGYQHVEPAFLGPYLGDIDMEVTNGIGLDPDFPSSGVI